MLSLPSAVRILVASDPVDMRKGIDGLVGLTVRALGEDAFSGHVFVFMGRSRMTLKALYWDTGGFVLVQKRLEAGRFRRPSGSGESRAVQVDATALAMLLDGIDVGRVRRPSHWGPGGRQAR